MKSKAVVETLKINTIKYVSTEGGVCTEIFKQKFQDKRRSYISQQSWYVQTKFSGKKQDSLKKKIQRLFFSSLILSLTASVEIEAILFGIFWEISQGCWHFQITCELAMVRGQTTEESMNFWKPQFKTLLKNY